jgi:hypothetical protein
LEFYEGFEIANHTLSHPFADKITPAEWGSLSALFENQPNQPTHEPKRSKQ